MHLNKLSAKVLSIVVIMFIFALTFSISENVAAEESDHFSDQQGQTFDGAPMEPAIPQQQGNNTLFRDVPIAMQPDILADPTTARARFVEVNFGLLPLTFGTGNTAQALSLNLFANVSTEFTFERLEAHGTDPDGYTWIGKVRGTTGNEAFLTVSDGNMDGVIHLDNNIYTVSAASDSLYVIKQVAVDALPMNPNDFVPVRPPASFKEDETSVVPATEANPIEIDVMVVYTPSARSQQGGTTAVQNAIQSSISATNQSYINTSINIRVNLVHMAEVNYVEVGGDGIDLERLQDSSDGYMDNVHALREQYRADLVALVTTAGNYCGIGYLMTPVGSYFQQFAFSITRLSCLSNYTMAHELGHNMGNAHDFDNAGGQGAYSYSYGYQDPNSNFRTIMAYFNGCGSPCPMINYFSNNGVVSYEGRPMGNASIDNRRSMNNTAPTVAAFRSRTLSPPILVSPTTDETTDSQTVTFTWQEAPSDNITGYDLRITTSSSPSSGVLVNTTFNNSTFSYTYTFASSGTYYWHMRTDTTGSSSSWTTRRFYVLGDSFCDNCNEIVVTTTNDELNNDGDCSLREAIQAVNTSSTVDNCPAGSNSQEDVITLSSSTYFLSRTGRNENNNSTGDFDILSNVQIVGNGRGSTIIDANQIDRVFHVRSGSTLIITDLAIRDGQTTDRGGGIFNENSTLDITNVLFTNNHSDKGGAIGGTGNSNGSTTVTGSRFAQNSAANGGAVELNGQENFTSTNNQYESNNATLDGGAIKLNFVASATLNGDTFTNNEADRQGGGFFAGSVFLTITNTLFEDNVAFRGGGAVVKRWASGNGNDTATLSNVTFRRNTASEYGGGLFGEQVTVEVNDSLFNSNTATIRGGGYMGVENSSTFNYTTFRSNLSEKGGAASAPQYAGTAATSITFYQSTLDSNSVTVKGGAYHGLNGELIINASLITDNTTSDNGAGISTFQTNVRIANSTVTGNVANEIGGGIDLRGAHNSDIFNSTIVNNNARFGGGVYNQQGRVEIDNATVTNNSSNGRGAGVYNIDGQMIISNSIIIGNNTFDNQDCFNTGSGTLSASNRNLAGNNTGCSGASITVNPNNAYSIVLSDTLADNGGPTPTLALLNNSPAIDAGSCTISYDQRNQFRPIDIPGMPNYTNGCDIGAYEAQLTQNELNEDVVQTTGDWATVYNANASDGFYQCSTHENATLSFETNSIAFSVITANRAITGTYGIDVNGVLQRTVDTRHDGDDTIFATSNVIMNPNRDTLPLLVTIYPVDGMLCIDGFSEQGIH